MLRVNQTNANDNKIKEIEDDKNLKNPEIFAIGFHNERFSYTRRSFILESATNTVTAQHTQINLSSRKTRTDGMRS